VPTLTKAEQRRRVGQLARLWGELTLAGILILTALVLWHLRRRGRLIRERLGPPRRVRGLETELPERPDAPS
jgi:hypothetical protein